MLVLLLGPAAPAAMQGPPPVPYAIDPAGIGGTLVVAGGGALPQAVYEAFVEAAGGEGARIVVIPTASGRADAADATTAVLEPWLERPHESVEVLHTRDRERADQPEFSAGLERATGVWIGGGSQSRILDAYEGTLVETRLVELLSRGGVIGGSSAGAACMSEVMIAGGMAPPDLRRGFDLLPHAIVDQHFTERDRAPRLRAAIATHPGRFGVGVDEGTALIVRGRDMRVVGRGRVHLFAASGAGRDAREVAHGAEDRIDLVSWQRGARERLRPVFPALDLRPTGVDRGHVMLVGGGRVGDALMQEFVRLAGGEGAAIAVVPTALGPRGASYRGMNEMLERLGVADVRTFHVEHPSEVAEHPDLGFLQRATGVWFVGGRQWRLVDAFEGTEALPAFHAVLARGGVVGGSSAGTSIQPEYMVRGNPLGNRDMMAFGYERGFGLLRGVAADQHFAQRNRFADLAAVVERFPQLVGLGIDESTAAVVSGPWMRVLGAGQVAIYDRRTPPAAAGRDHVALASGGRYDLVEGKVAQ